MRNVAKLILLGVFMVSCGGGDVLDASGGGTGGGDEFGACSSSVDVPSTLDEIVGQVEAVYSFTPENFLAALDKAAGTPGISDSNRDVSGLVATGELISGSEDVGSEGLVMGYRDLEHSRVSPESDQVLVGVRSSRLGPGVVMMVVEVGDQGGFRIGALCGETMLAPDLRAFAETKPGPPSDVVRQLLTSPDRRPELAEWLEARRSREAAGPPPWVDRDPRERFVHPEETPAAVLDALTPLEIQIEIPSSWAALDIAIGTWTAEGWQEAALVNGTFDEVAGDRLRGTLYGYTTGSTPVEIWALDSLGTVDPPLKQLFTLRANDLHRQDDGRLVARVDIDAPDIASRKALQALDAATVAVGQYVAEGWRHSDVTTESSVIGG